VGLNILGCPRKNKNSLVYLFRIDLWLSKVSRDLIILRCPKKEKFPLVYLFRIDFGGGPKGLTWSKHTRMPQRINSLVYLFRIDFGGS
jgi:hypothetical protein